MKYPNSLQELIEYFKLLPGIGEKNAERLALATLNFKEDDLMNEYKFKVERQLKRIAGENNE